MRNAYHVVTLQTCFSTDEANDSNANIMEESGEIKIVSCLND